MISGIASVIKLFGERNILLLEIFEACVVCNPRMAPRYFLMPLKLGVAEAAVDALVQELEDILSVKNSRSVIDTKKQF